MGKKGRKGEERGLKLRQRANCRSIHLVLQLTYVFFPRKDQKVQGKEVRKDETKCKEKQKCPLVFLIVHPEQFLISGTSHRMGIRGRGR